MLYPEAQLLNLLAWTLRDHAMVVSGAYKQTKSERGDGQGGWRPMTDDEKLEQAMLRLTCRCYMISDQAECLAELALEHTDD